MAKKYTIFTFGKASKGWIACTVIANLVVVAVTIVFFDRIGFIVDTVNSGTLTNSILTTTAR